MADSSHITTLPERECITSTDGIMARRLKNRERQRRYRARKRLEADMKKSYLIDQCALLQKPQSNEVAIKFEACGALLPTESQSNGTYIKFDARVHCNRDWKKDARKVQVSKEPENSFNGSLDSVKTLLEAELSFKLPMKLTGRRHWKADARKKIDTDSHGNDSTD